jgi:tripartite-type tricarboxylate transporter receptor subunit TctC
MTACNRSRLSNASVVALVIFGLGLLSVAGQVTAAGVREGSPYPGKPVRILVPYAPGGGSDLVARTLSPRLSERLGQPVVVDNRPAVGGILATEMAAQSNPDGYTLLIASAPHAAFPALYPKLRFDAVKSFAPITLACVSPLVAVVNSSFPANTLQEFISYARANPTKINFGSSGTGSPIHLAGELFKSMAKIDMTHIMYKGIAPAITAVLGNEIQILFPAVFLARPHVSSGRLRALGITSLKRTEIAPDWPTIAESGLPGYEASIWYGFMAPAGTPAPIVARLNQEIIAILKIPQVRQSFRAQGCDAVASTPDEFSAVLRKDVDRLGKLIKERGIRIE